MNSSNISGNLPEKKIRQLQSFLTHTKFSQDHINKIESPHEFMGKNLLPVNSAIFSSKIEYTIKGQLMSEGNFGVFNLTKSEPNLMKDF